MAEAEQSRLEMSTRIETLEADKKSLEAENAKAIQENRGLLNQLEELNNSIADSETQVKSLEATLHSTQQELRRLEGIAQRTHDLEVQLAALEQEQAILQQTVTTTAAEERTAIQRWRKAERGLYEIQEQLEKIEREAREERERHVEVVGRMQRQRTVEKELETASGRLKGAAAATSLGQGKNGSNVVSHFVKDILQDNANLQMGIVELREMLMNSNDEVQTLREQLMLHQPISGDAEDGSGPPTLRAELAPKEPTEPHVVSQELHIHHHYHTPVRKDEIRRPKKKRNVIHSGLFTPPSGMQPSRNMQMRPTAASAAAAILSNTAITIPPLTPTNNRWSMQSGQTASDFAPSSAPSSPQSTHHLFDRGFIDQAFDSRPTSPGSSVDPMSPLFKPYHRKRGSEHSTRSFTAPNAFHPNNVIHEEEDNDVDELTDLDAAPSGESNLHDESEASGELNLHDESEASLDDFFSSQAFQPSLRRSTSHESILSISGIDIHTLHSRPSQITITGSGAMLRSQTRLGYGSPSTSFISTEPIISSSMTIAQPTLSRTGHNSTSYLRSSMGLPERPISRGSIHSGTSNSSNGDGLGKKVGGWVWSRWGVAPTPSSPSSLSQNYAPRTPQTPKAAVPQRAVSTPAVTVTPPVDPLRLMMGRSPGINQKGPIPGFRRPEKAPSNVTPTRVDQDALREVLME